ncbi:hypothetical protein ABES03_20650 [Neobacillus rhizosphaerae]|uniref:hypothetical protein n=1 Tax=Neobacillus rhizosphaerae TaxID=2880965 RepID=UPI003D28DB2B
MIKNKKFLYFALIPFILSMAVNFPFPDVVPDDHLFVTVFNIPLRTKSGINYIGIFTLLLLIFSLYLLVKSLKKFHVRFVILAILVFVLTPPFLATSFQKTIATGIYAVSYNVDKSKCHFEKINETTLHMVCELPLENHNDEGVEFTVEFNAFDSFPNKELMNSHAPYMVRLKGKERKVVKVETNIDISKQGTRMDGGEIYGFNIIIRSDGERRQL